jgi:protein-tyrosine phosphatase
MCVSRTDVGRLSDSRRVLDWDGCHNVRDLGGLPTMHGGVTRFGAVVRADAIGSLTAEGREDLLALGVSRIVDLRFTREVGEMAPSHLPVETVRVSLFGDHEASLEGAWLDRVRASTDLAESFAYSYTTTLERRADNVRDALEAVAGAPEGCVIVHCAVGKDRTGVVAALLLALAGVPAEAIAQDYAASAEGVERLSVDWLTGAKDEDERELRRRLIASPVGAMHRVLDHLHLRFGGVERYVREIGIDARTVDTLRARLLP